MAKNKLSNLLMGAAVAGLVTGVALPSFAKDGATQTSEPEKKKEGDKDSCKGKDHGDHKADKKGDKKKGDEKHEEHK
jgi:hypothetical protein